MAARRVSKLSREPSGAECVVPPAAMLGLSGSELAMQYGYHGDVHIHWEKRPGVRIVAMDSHYMGAVNERDARAWARRFAGEHPEAVAECERMMDKLGDGGAAGSVEVAGGQAPRKVRPALTDVECR